MAPLDDTTPATRFASFDIYRTSYKKIRDHEVEVGILVPKCLEPGKHPVIAIVVLPNYRLIPEHTGADILKDLNDFWKWFHSDKLTSFLTPKLESPPDFDYSKVLVSGDSAGGYMALMSGLTQPKGTINAILAQYPMTNYLRREKLDMYLDRPAPRPWLITDHISSIVPGKVISSSTPPSRMRLSYALSAYGRYLEFFGSDPKLWPVNLIENKEYVPPTWIIHGDADIAVSIGDSKAFVKQWDKHVEGSEVRLEIRPGGDHGFDISMKEDEEVWLREGLKWVEGKWLK